MLVLHCVFQCCPSLMIYDARVRLRASHESYSMLSAQGIARLGSKKDPDATCMTPRGCKVKCILAVLVHITHICLQQIRITSSANPHTIPNMPLVYANPHTIPRHCAWSTP